MRRALIGAVTAVAVPLVLTACSGASHPGGSASSSSSGQSTPVYLGGDPARIPLTGSTSAPLRFEQPTVTGDAGELVTAFHRLQSLDQIFDSSQFPVGQNVAPLLARVFTADELATEQQVLAAPLQGNLSQVHNRAVATKVIDATVSGDVGTVSYCSVFSGQADTEVGPFATQFRRVPVDGGVDWREAKGDVSASNPQYNCSSWAKTVK